MLTSRSDHHQAHDRRRRTVVVPIGFALLLALAGAPWAACAEDARRGELLYENHCGDCHDRNVHRRDTRRIADVRDVRAWVASWSLHTGLGWSASDIDDVTLYLARHVYGFDR